MSSNIQEKSIEKIISLDIQENIMTKRFMMKTLKSMSKSDEYKQDIVFNSPLGDSMVMKMKCSTNQELTLSMESESGISLKVTGGEKIVQNFIHNFTVEALSILATELSLCLKAENPSISEENLKQKFRKKLTIPIHDSIQECSLD